MDGINILKNKSFSSKNVILIRSRAIDPSVLKVAKTLAENGYDVRVLLWDRTGRRKKVEITDGYITVYFGAKAPHDKITAALLLPLWWLYELLFLIIHSIEIIHACDLDTLLPAIIAKRIKKAKLCYTIYDFYADNLPKSFPLLGRKLIAYIERFGIGLCDAVFIVDPSRYEQIKKARIRKLGILYNSPPDCAGERLLLNPKITPPIILFYAGLIDRSRGLIDVIKAVRDIDDVVLIVAGVGPDVKMFENLSRSLKDKVKYIGFIPYNEVIKKTLEADILFALYDPSIPNNLYASPNKLFEAMMCGKPIIVNDGTSMSNIVKEEDCGLVVPYGDVKAIKEAILKLKNDPELRQTLGMNGRKAYEERYSWRIMEKKLLELYANLFDENG